VVFFHLHRICSEPIFFCCFVDPIFTFSADTNTRHGIILFISNISYFLDLTEFCAFTNVLILSCHHVRGIEFINIIQLSAWSERGDKFKNLIYLDLPCYTYREPQLVELNPDHILLPDFFIHAALPFSKFKSIMSTRFILTWQLGSWNASSWIFVYKWYTNLQAMVYVNVIHIS